MAINFLNITETLVEARINDNTVGSNLPTPRLAFKENGVVSGGISTTGGNLILETSSGTERVRITTTGNAVFAGDISLADGKKLQLGAANDLQIYHDGTDSFINNDGTGHLYIQQFNNDKDIYFKNDNGSGGIATYFYLDGSLVNGSSVLGATRFPDKSQIFLGTGGDMALYHDGTNSFISNGTGDITIENSSNDSDIIFRSDDGSGGLATYFYLDGSAGLTKFSIATRHLDSVRAYFGQGNDLQIYHDGSNSHIKTSSSSTGDLFITSQGTNHDLYLQAADDIYLRPQGTENGVVIVGNGDVTLYYDNAAKLSTTSQGISVSGDVSSGDITIAVDDTPTLNFKKASSADVLGIINVTTDAGSGGKMVFQTKRNGNTPLDALTIDDGQNATFAGEVEVINANGLITGRSSSSSNTNSSLRFMGGAYTGNKATAILYDGVNGENQLYLGGGTGLGEPATSIRFNTGSAGATGAGTERMRITSSGFVGIGSNSPVAPLEVKSSELNHLTLYRPANTTEGNAGSMNFDGNDSDSNQQTYAKIESFTDDATAGSHAGKIRFSIAKGASGITSAMTIQKDAQVSLNQYGQGSYTGTAAYTLQVDSAGNIIEGSTSGGGTVTGSGTATRVAFWSGTTALSSDANLYWDNTNDRLGIGTSSPATYLQLGDYPSNNIDITTYPDVPSEHMIHITAPETTGRYGGGISFGENTFTAANITVQDAGGSGALHMLFGTGTSSGVTEKMRITNAGNVGIGTTAPNETLSLYKSDRPYIQFISNTTGTTSSDGSFIGFANADGFLEIRNKEAQPIRLSTSDTERMRITSAGELQLTQSNAEFDFTSSSSSGYKTTFNMDDTGLDIGHNSSGRALNLQTHSTDRLTITGAGNVGIGTTSPGSLLHVDGSITSAALQVNQTGTGIIANFKQGGNSKIVIDNDGDLGIGTTSPSAKLEVVQAVGSIAQNIINESEVGFRLSTVVENTTVNTVVFRQGIYHNTTENATIAFGRGNNTTGGFITFQTNNGTTALTLDSSQKATFANDLYIPDQIIHSGDTNTYIQFHAADQFRVVTGGAERFEVNNTQVTANSEFIATGDVGIGTTSPNTKLHVSSAAGFPQIRFQEVGSAEAVGLRFQAKTGAEAQVYADIKFDPDSAELVINNPYNSGTQGLTVDSSSNVLVGNDLYVPDQIIHTGDTDTYMQFNAANTWRIVTGGNERMRVDSSGNVGIDVSSPQGKFHVVGSALGNSINNTSTDAIFQSANANQALLSIQNYRTSAGSDWTSASKRIQMRIDSTHMGWMQFNGTGNNGGISWGAGTSTTQANITEKMTLKSNGRLGIGTTSPSQKLSVNGGKLLVQDVHSSGDTPPALTLGQLNNQYQSGIQSNGHLTSKVVGSGNWYWYDDANIRMFLSNAGNLGIGSTSPDGKLTISGTGTSTAPTISVINTSSTAFNHSINAFTPNLTSGESNILVFGRAGSTKNSAYIGYRYSGTAGSNDNLLILGHWASDNLMTISGDGKVGIGTGTTSPTDKLQIDAPHSQLRLRDTDDTTFTQFSSSGGKLAIRQDSTTASHFWMNSSGNVGIGNSNPANKLSVNLTSSVALASQPAVPLFVGNNGNGVDGRVFIDVKHDVISTASAIGAGLRMQAGAVTTGTASYNSSLIFLQSAAPGSNTIHSAPKAIQFYVDNHDTAAGSGSNYSQYGDLAMTIAENASVGIGTTSPGTVNGTAFGGVMLHVKGPSNIGRLVLEGAVQGTMLMNATGSTANQRLKFIQSKQNEFRMGKVSDSGTETTQLAIDDAGDVILQAAGKGLVLVSPNGTTYRLSVSNDGELETTVV